jgi:CO dehydrogenase/acetyl-CoA synthase delta subunit
MSAFRKKLDEIGASADCSCGEDCCGPAREDASSLVEPTSVSAAWITGRTETAGGTVPVVADHLDRSDKLGTWKARWGVGRMMYTVPPGLYAVGKADPWSPVLVTANYKMSFDAVRASLAGRSAWILVLDTRGINVWCAAGKGTFGTDELVTRVKSVNLAGIVSHRTLILPQLGAPGVASHLVVKGCGFRIIFGPVRAADIPAFLDAGMKATPEMRRVRFRFRDRIVLAPIEIVGVLTNKYFLALLGLWIIGLLGVRFLAFDMIAILGAIVAGTILVPAMLPWIPGRAFAVKGALIGIVWAVAVCLFRGVPAGSAASWLSAVSYVLALPALSAFLAMNFTGSSTITSLSGVVREMRAALPPIIVGAVLGFGAMIAGFFLPRM